MSIVEGLPVSKKEEHVGKLIEREEYGIEYNVRFGKYVVDIYIPEFHLGVEVDSPYHTFKTRDKKRDEYLLEECFLPICRVNNLTTALDNIRSFIILYTMGNMVKERMVKYDERDNA